MRRAKSILSSGRMSVCDNFSLRTAEVMYTAYSRLSPRPVLILLPFSQSGQQDYF